MFLGTGRILRPVQTYCLGLGQAEYEIRREARGIALDLLVEALGSHAIEGGELRKLLDVLHLLPHLFDEHFHIDRGARGFDVLRLG